MRTRTTLVVEGLETRAVASVTTSTRVIAVDTPNSQAAGGHALYQDVTIPAAAPAPGAVFVGDAADVAAGARKPYPQDKIAIPPGVVGEPNGGIVAGPGGNGHIK